MSQANQKTTVSDAVRKHKEFLFPAVATFYQEPIALVKGEGEHVWDDQGNKYLDCFGGVLTVSVGHANPEVNKAWIDQVNSISHTSTLYANQPQSDLAEKLAEISPGNLKKSFFLKEAIMFLNAGYFATLSPLSNRLKPALEAPA